MKTRHKGKTHVKGTIWHLRFAAFLVLAFAAAKSVFALSVLSNWSVSQGLGVASLGSGVTGDVKSHYQKGVGTVEYYGRHGLSLSDGQTATLRFGFGPWNGNGDFKISIVAYKDSYNNGVTLQQLSSGSLKDGYGLIQSGKWMNIAYGTRATLSVSRCSSTEVTIKCVRNGLGYDYLIDGGAIKLSTPSGSSAGPGVMIFTSTDTGGTDNHNYEIGYTITGQIANGGGGGGGSGGGGAAATMYRVDVYGALFSGWLDVQSGSPLKTGVTSYFGRPFDEYIYMQAVEFEDNEYRRDRHMQFLASHELIGWFTEPEGGRMVDANTIVTGDMTIFAHWSCNVSFDANGGTGIMAAQSLLTSGERLNRCAFSRQGYEFAGWSTEPDGETQYSDEDPFYFKYYTSYSDTTLYAQWREKQTLEMNLKPQAPTDWSSPIVVTTVQNGRADTVTLTTNDTVYAYWCVWHHGGNETDLFDVSLSIDGGVPLVWTCGNLAAGLGAYAGMTLGKLAEGWHTLKLVADPEGRLDETDETDNVFEKSFYVSSPGGTGGTTDNGHEPKFEIRNSVLVSVSLNGATAVTIPKEVRSIGEAAFRYCTTLKSVSIPNTVTNIGERAFANCSALQEISIPFSVVSIGRNAFHHCIALKSATLPEGLTAIEPQLFRDCQSLDSIVVPQGVETIGENAFENCISLETISLPDTLRTIAEGAFYDCSAVKSVIIPTRVSNIGYAAFCGCFDLCSFTILGALEDYGIDIFDGSQLWTDSILTDFTVQATSLWTGPADVWLGRKVEISGADTPGPGGGEKPASETPGYGVIEPEYITEAFEAPKAVTLQGAVYAGDAIFGVVELKLGKVNARKGSSKVSGTVTTLDGKKHVAKAVNVTGIDGGSPIAVSLDVKDFGKMDVSIGGALFAGTMGSYHVQTADVGGAWAASTATVSVDADDLSMFTGRVLDGLLPDAEAASVVGGKWKFAGAAAVKWAKPKKGAALPDIYDGESGKGLIVDESRGKTNLSGLKLTYTPKKGTFKGSFKLHELQGAGKATKLKKYTVSIAGLVVDGVGCGTATCKKPVVTWPVSVE